MTTFAILLCLHLCAVIFWVGGMAIMHIAVRPSAVEMLEPPQRLPFMAVTLGRFFLGVTISIVVLLVTGAWMMHFMASVGRLPHSVEAMAGLGILMMAIFGHVRFAAFPKLRRAIAAKAWPEAGKQLGIIRQLVALNLTLGVVTVVIAIIGRTALV
ncbi:CopD family protein [Uliginosibacterium sp. H3]|uniref:CopD family protein n=1 Tax=Uliginosibacterium silvisoli TaxID=3114758 RepID=A0ABU6K929_9RHOO|nr:CopD family protein [Uliginosibacterium sp. H3]